MARPRKEYGTEQARIETLRKANRDRVNRHRMLQRVKAKEMAELIRRANSDEGLILPTVELATEPVTAARSVVNRKLKVDFGDPDVDGFADDEVGAKHEPEQPRDA